MKSYMDNNYLSILFFDEKSLWNGMQKQFKNASEFFLLNAKNLEELFETVRVVCINILFIDISGWDNEDFDYIPIIKELQPNACIIMLIHNENDKIMRKLHNCGVDGYVTLSEEEKEEYEIKKFNNDLMPSRINYC